MNNINSGILPNEVVNIMNLKQIENELKELITQIIDSIVMVLIPKENTVTCINVAQDNKYLDSATTGFYIDGHVVVTAAHSLRNLFNEKVCLLNLDGDIIEGSIIDVDPKWDLMFIYSDAIHTPIPLRDNLISIGSFVIVCGSAYGVLRPFLSIGIISGSEIKANVGYGLVEGLLLVSSPILLGMSGSPIIDLNGLSVGMVIAKAFDANEFSLAVPSTRILYSYKILKKYGKIMHIVLGINVLSLKNIITMLGLQYGLVISKILNSNLYKFCQICEGDVLLSINNRKMYTIEDLRLALDEALLNHNILVIEYINKANKKVYSCIIDDLAAFTTSRFF
jgi:S1-C subfamily serine protease